MILLPPHEPWLFTILYALIGFVYGVTYKRVWHGLALGMLYLLFGGYAHIAALAWIFWVTIQDAKRRDIHPDQQRHDELKALWDSDTIDAEEALEFAKRLHKARRFEDALTAVDSALAQLPHVREAWILKAKTHRALEQFEEEQKARDQIRDLITTNG